MSYADLVLSKRAHELQELTPWEREFRRRLLDR